MFRFRAAAALLPAAAHALQTPDAKAQDLQTALQHAADAYIDSFDIPAGDYLFGNVSLTLRNARDLRITVPPK